LAWSRLKLREQKGASTVTVTSGVSGIVMTRFGMAFDVLISSFRMSYTFAKKVASIDNVISPKD